MFQRGQKITVLESSAKSGIHPRAGDVGYLDNMYLFPRFRFILLNAFFFAYNSGNRNTVEKKKFVIDLGMNRDMRFKISNKGIPVKFFTNSIDFVNLSPVGYQIRRPEAKTLDIRGNRLLVSYPQMYSNYGIWPYLRKETKINFIEDRVVKIPYGQIALFNTKSVRKYSMIKCGDVELTAWLRSMAPMIASTLNVLCDYTARYQSDNIENGYFWLARKMWDELFREVIRFNFPALPQKRPGGNYETVSTYNFDKLDKLRANKKTSLVENVNRLNSLTSIFLQRLDSYHLNISLNPEVNPAANSLSIMWESFGIINGTDSIDSSAYVYLYDLVRSMFFRAAMMPNNTYMRLKSLARCLPSEWQNDNELKCKVKTFDDIKAAASSDSSALNRIYEVIK